MVTTVPAESQGYVDTEVQEGIHTAVMCGQNQYCGRQLPLPARGRPVDVSCVEGPWSLPERSCLSALLHPLV